MLDVGDDAGEGEPAVDSLGVGCGELGEFGDEVGAVFGGDAPGEGVEAVVLREVVAGDEALAEAIGPLGDEPEFEEEGFDGDEDEDAG